MSKMDWWIDDDRSNSKKLVPNLRQSGRGKILVFSVKKTNYIILNIVQQNMKICLDVSYPVWWDQSEVRSVWRRWWLTIWSGMTLPLQLQKGWKLWYQIRMYIPLMFSITIAVKCAPPPPFCRGDWASNQIFKKGGWLDRTSTFRGGLLGKRGDDFFHGGLQF